MKTLKTALLFPGQGSQIVGMGKDFFENFRESALVFEEASDTIHLNLKKLCFDGPLDELTLTENLQPALFTTEAAILAGMRAHAEIDPVLCAGHSLGEYSALHAAGSLSVAEGARLTKARGKAMQAAVPIGRGAMAAVLGIEGSAVESLCEKSRQGEEGDVVEPANYNAPGQVVIAGTAMGIGRFEALAKEDPALKRAKIIRLQVSAPFHCSLMAPAQKQMEALLLATPFRKLVCPVIANCTAQPVRSETEVAALLLAQIVRPVRWDASMTLLRNFEVTQAIEVGPGRVLSGLHKRIDREMPVKNIATVDELKEVLK